MGIESVIFVENGGGYKVKVQVLVEEDEGGREEEEPEEEKLTSPLDDYNDHVEGGATEEDPKVRGLDEVSKEEAEAILLVQAVPVVQIESGV